MGTSSRGCKVSPISEPHLVHIYLTPNTQDCAERVSLQVSLYRMAIEVCPRVVQRHPRPRPLTKPKGILKVDDSAHAGVLHGRYPVVRNPLLVILPTSRPNVDSAYPCQCRCVLICRLVKQGKPSSPCRPVGHPKTRERTGASFGLPPGRNRGCRVARLMLVYWSPQ